MTQYKCCQCLQLFSALKLPRMMPACLHNICEKCLNEVFSQLQDEIRCGFCSNVVSLENLNSASFLKNISLFHRKAENFENPEQSQMDLTDGQMLLVLDEPAEATLPQQICKLHNRQKQIICITDKHMICSHCALFGAHNGHHIITQGEMSKKEAEKIQSISALKRMKKNQLLNYELKLSEISIRQKMETKKGQILNAIFQWFGRLKKEVSDAQVSLEHNVDKHFEQTYRILGQYQNQKSTIKKIENWELQVNGLIGQLEQEGNLLRKIDLLYGSLNQTEAIGEELLKELKQRISESQICLNEAIEKIVVITKEPKILLKSIESCIKIEKQSKEIVGTCTHPLEKSMNLKQSKSSESIASILNNSCSTGLLDDSFKVSKRSELFSPKAKTNMLKNSKVHPNQADNTKPAISRVTSPRKQFFPVQIPLMKEKIARKSKGLNYGSSVEERISDFMKEGSDLLDFTGCQLSEQAIVNHVQSMGATKIIRGLKLVRNHLTASGLIQILPSLKNVVSLHLSENPSLTEEVLDIILEHIEGLPKLRLMTMDCGRMNQRQAKWKVDQLKKRGIIVTFAR